MSDKVDTYSVRCNCGTCMSLRDAMGASCTGCSHRHDEVVTLRDEVESKNHELADRGQDYAKIVDHAEYQGKLINEQSISLVGLSGEVEKLTAENKELMEIIEACGVANRQFQENEHKFKSQLTKGGQDE